VDSVGHNSNFSVYKHKALQTYDFYLFLRERISHLGRTLKWNSRIYGGHDIYQDFSLLILILLGLISPTNFAINIQWITENSTTKFNFSTASVNSLLPIHYRINLI